MKTFVLLLLTIVFVQTQSAASAQISNDAFTPLMRVVASGQLDDVRQLLKDGADVNEQLPGIGITALMIAVGRGDVEIVRVLLAAGANPNAAGGIAHVGFWSPLTSAMNSQNKNRLQLVDMLIAAGAKLNPPSSFPESPLMAAVRDSDIEMIRALLKRGSDVNWQNQIGDTALVTATTMGEPNVDVVRLLLNAGANPNKSNLWTGNDCVSLLTYLSEWLSAGKDKVRLEIRRMIVNAGGKEFRTSSTDKPCYQ